MTMMEDSKMCKIEYDRKAIMYSIYDIPHKLCNIFGNEISSNPDYHPIMLADPCVSSNAPLLGASGEPGRPCSILFPREGSRPLHKTTTCEIDTAKARLLIELFDLSCDPI